MMMIQLRPNDPLLAAIAGVVHQAEAAAKAIAAKAEANKQDGMPSNSNIEAAAHLTT